MGAEAYKVTRYRWAVLAAFMAVNATIQTLWISYAPVAGLAAAWYGIDSLGVGLFAMSFMIAFIPLSLPASWLIDRLGFAVAVGAASALAGLFGILRGLAGRNYALALLATAGLAAVQPFLLNAWTKMPAAWFPRKERATAVGLVTLANILGTAAGLVLPPLLVGRLGIGALQLRFGLGMALAAVLFLALARERPALPPDESAAAAATPPKGGFRLAWAAPSFRRYLLMAFIGMGVFNGVTTWIEAIATSRGIEPGLAGLLGALMLGGGVAGALVVPAISDRRGRRKPYILLGLFGAAPFALFLALAPGFPAAAAASILLGFFLVAVSPVGMQYAAEAARPAPEGSSNGIVTLAGQASVVLVWAMEAVNRLSGSFTTSLLLAALLLLGAGVLGFGLKEEAAKDQAVPAGSGPA